MWLEHKEQRGRGGWDAAGECAGPGGPTWSLNSVLSAVWSHWRVFDPEEETEDWVPF